MKTIKYFTCIFLLFSFKPLLSQNWMPLEVGNKLQYIITEYGGIFTIPDTLYYNISIYYDEVLSDTLINNNTYYNFSKNPQNWFRFNQSEKKIYYWWENEDKLIMDFNLEPDSFFISYLPAPANYQVPANIVSGDYSLFDTLQTYKGFWWTITLDGAAGEIIKYIPNYGVVYDSSYFYDGGSFQYTISILKLVQANISGINLRGTEVPEIFIEPIYSVSDSNFSLNLNVSHPFNVLFPVNPAFSGLNYIDSVYLHSYYSNNDSIVYNPKTLAVNLTETETWQLNIALNMDLMLNYYKYYYKIEAIDRGLIPHRSFAPDSGYFVAVYDTTSGITLIDDQFSSFSLKQNYPNPFNPSTKIKYSVPQSSKVIIKVFDILGNEIEVLVNEEKQTGTYETEFSGTELPSGIYFYQLLTRSFVQTKKMILLK